LAEQHQHWRAFSADWFDKHQSVLLRLANAPVLGRRFRSALSLRDDLPIVRLTPSAAHYATDDRQRVAELFSYPRHSHRIYEAYQPIWWGMHWFDELIADRFAPELSFGFDTLTRYTGAGTVQSFDGVVSSSDSVYSTALAGSNLFTDVTATRLSIEASRAGAGTSGDPYVYYISRGFLKFDVSSLPDSNLLINSAVLSLVLESSQNPSTFSLQIFESSVSDGSTDLTSGDWSAFFSTEFGSKALSGWTTGSYQDVTLNSSGRDYIKNRSAGYAKFAIRHSRESSGSVPSNTSIALLYSADQSGTSFDPKLVITYSLGVFPSSIASTTALGSPTIVAHPPPVLPPGIAPTLSIGLPIVSSGAALVYPGTIAPTSAVGTPQIPTIMAVGIASTVSVGTPRIPVIQPTGIDSTAACGEPALSPADGKIMRVESGIASTLTVGTPAILRSLREIYLPSIGSTSSVGRPSLAMIYPASVYISRLIDEPIEYDYTLYEFEDGATDVNVQPCGIRRWSLQYEGLSAAEAQTLLNFYNSVRGRSTVFNFYHRRDAITYTGVRLVSMTMASRAKAWVNGATVVLEKLA
jgi:hypothetical protein